MWKRILVPVPLGVAATLALLYVMHALIYSGEDVITAPRKAPTLLLHARVEEPVKVAPVEPPSRIDPPPEPPPARPVDNTGSGETSVGVIRTSLPAPPTEYQTVGLPMTDGPLVAIVRVAPEYPTTLGARGVEGFVTVRFDVDTRGQTRNVTVVASSHAGFERAAVRAAEKFRYRAQIVDGQPVTTTGLHYRFRFELDDT